MLPATVAGWNVVEVIIHNSLVYNDWAHHLSYLTPGLPVQHESAVISYPLRWQGPPQREE